MSKYVYVVLEDNGETWEDWAEIITLVADDYDIAVKHLTDKGFLADGSTSRGASFRYTDNSYEGAVYDAVIEKHVLKR